MIGRSKTPLSFHNSGSRIATPRSCSRISNPFLTPNASTTELDRDTDPEKNFFLVDDRLAAPYDEKIDLLWPLIGDEKEDDDDMHMPQPDDDLKFKSRWRDHFRRGSIASTIGVFLMILGLLFLFITLPILSMTGIIRYNSAYETPLDQMPNFYPEPESWATVNNRTYALLANIRTDLIDRDTPQSAKTIIGEFGDEYELVFSDEFNDSNRTFYEGDDPYWFAPDIWYGATKDLDWYDPDAVTTRDGALEIRLDKFPNHGLEFRSGMLNSWNHLCFKGGIFEVSVSLPGPAAVQGLWPGAWTMGNLGRPGYLSTTEGLWPYTYQACDVGITPNQSSHDGLSYLPGQKLPSCTCPGEDHPTRGTGRGAPEIDIMEAGASWGDPKLPIATQSYQVAPFDIWWYPDYNFTAFPAGYEVSYTNGYTGGPYQQAISATTNLNSDWYDGKAYQRYSFEYVPGEGKDAYIAWKVGGQTTFMMDGRAIGPNGNIQARQISEEPMSMILNLGISNSWTFIDWPSLVFPTVYRVDYVRWYQKKGQEMVTCDPPGFETTQYINDHILAYTNPNFTSWKDTGYSWPKHKLNSDC
ncbi:glycoside hydrolase family 16 protein [Lophiostoma macrostomum CBS 122681]|uniref:Glycoside hydrolase family 16 protein n=1 Tax=Lophiostoma macrostomum CBS 122681 TaxID=1314788 RepID=A0A6A6THU0_9PLEO|nr:glycoside hydrolase family 16 protein [Lophiostoma macrostomum CBS 122681]